MTTEVRDVGVRDAEELAAFLAAEMIDGALFKWVAARSLAVRVDDALAGLALGGPLDGSPGTFYLAVFLVAPRWREAYRFNRLVEAVEELLAAEGYARVVIAIPGERSGFITAARWFGWRVYAEERAATWLVKEFVDSKGGP